MFKNYANEIRPPNSYTIIKYISILRSSALVKVMVISIIVALQYCKTHICHTEISSR